VGLTNIPKSVVARCGLFNAVLPYFCLKRLIAGFWLCTSGFMLSQVCVGFVVDGEGMAQTLI